MLLQKSHFVNCSWSQAFFLVSETKRKFLAGNSSRTKVFLPEKKVFFSVSAAAASFPRWLTWKLWLTICWPLKNKRNLSTVFAIETTVALVQSQKLKRSWEFFNTSVSSIYSLGSLLLHIWRDLCSGIILLTNFGQQQHYAPNGNKEKSLIDGTFVEEKAESSFQRHLF